MRDRQSHSRLLPPWTAEETPGGFVVVSAGGVKLAYVYVSSHVSQGGLTSAEARDIALAISRLKS